MHPNTAVPFLHTITLTGIDDHTDLAALGDLAQQYPCVEFALLLGRRNLQGPRNEFPSIDTLLLIRRFAEASKDAGTRVRLAGHVCGWWASSLLKGRTEVLDQFPLEVWRMCSRLQLNIGWAVDRGNLSAEDMRLDGLADHKATKHLQAIIIQCGENESVAGQVIDARGEISLPVQVLFDESAGRGVPLTRHRYWPGVDCGFAGGLKPENVANYCAQFADYMARQGLVPQGQVWVDAQSGLRDETDRFSPWLAREFLQATAPFVLG